MSTPPFSTPARHGRPANDHGLHAGLAAVRALPAGRAGWAAAVLSRHSAARSMAPSAGGGDDGPAWDPRRGPGEGRPAGAGHRGRRRGGHVRRPDRGGVCSTRNAELVRSLGAAHVIDYTTDDFTGGRARYDVILDNVSSLPLSRLRGALTPKGTLVLNGGGSPGHVFGPVAGIVRAMVANAFVSQRLRPLPSRQNREELLAVTALIQDGKLTPVVDRTYPLADTAEGLRHVEQGHARGKIVITVA